MEETSKEGFEIVLDVIKVLLAHILKDPNLLKIHTEAPLSWVVLYLSFLSLF